MKASTNSVTVEIRDHTKTMAACSLLDRSSQVTQASSRLGGVHCITLSKSCRVQQPGCHPRHSSDGNTHAGIREETIQLSRNVEIDQVAIAELPLEGWNAMGGFVIHADAGRPREPVRDARRRAGTVLAEDLSAHGIEFTRRHTRRNGFHHGLAGFCNDSTSTEKRVQLLLVVNSHAIILGRETLCA